MSRNLVELKQTIVCVVHIGSCHRSLVSQRRKDSFFLEPHEAACPDQLAVCSYGP